MSDIIADIKVEMTSDGFQLVQRSLKDTKKGLDNVSTAQKKTKKSSNDFHKQQKSLYQSNLAGAKSFSKMAQTIGGPGGGSSTLVSAYATLAANVFAATAAFGALSRAAQFTKLREGLEIIGNQSGRTLSVLADQLREATGNALSLEQASSAAAIGISGGFGAKELTGLAEIAKGAATALGRDLGDAFDRLTRGAIKLEPEILDELGIMVRLDDAVEQYAAQLGKGASALTQMERRQAFMNAILVQGEAKFGEISKAADTTAYQKLGATFADLTKDIFNFINKTLNLETVVGLLASSTTTLFGVMLLFGSTIVGTMIPALTGFAGRAADVAENAFEMADGMAEFAKSQTAVARGQVGAFGLGTKNFQVFQKGIAAGTNSTKDLDKALLSLRRSESLRSKNLLAGSVKNKAAKEEELRLIRQQILLIEQLQAAETKQDVFSLAASNAKVQATYLKGNAEVLEQVSTGEIGLVSALTANNVLFNKRTEDLKDGAKKSGMFTRANTALKNSFGKLASQAKIAGAFLLKFLPIIAGITIAIGLALIVYDKFFNTKLVKEYKKELKTLGTILDSIADKGVEYQKAISGELPSQVSQIRQFQILSNTISETAEQLEKTRKARKALAEEREVDDIVKRQALPDFISTSDIFASSEAYEGFELLEKGAENASKRIQEMIGYEIPASALTSADEVNKALTGAFSLQGSAEIDTLKNLFESDIPQYGEFIKQNLTFGKLLEGDLTGFRDEVYEVTQQAALFFGNVGEAVTGVQNVLRDTEKTASQFMQKFLPKTNTTELINSLKQIQNEISIVEEEATRLQKYNTAESIVNADREIGVSFLNTGSSVADIFGGEFIQAQNKVLKTQNEIDKLRKDDIKDSLQKTSLGKLQGDLERQLIALGVIGNEQLGISLDTLILMTKQELTRKETQAQINQLKKAEKALLGKSKSSAEISNSILTKTLKLRKEEAYTTNQILGNKLGLTEAEMARSEIINNLEEKLKDSATTEQQKAQINIRLLEEKGIVLQSNLDTAQKAFNISNAALSVDKEALKIQERKEKLTQKENAFSNKAAGQAAGRKGASPLDLLKEQIRVENEKVTIAEEKARIEKQSAIIQATLLKAQVKAYQAAGFIESTVADTIISDIGTNLKNLTDVIDKEVIEMTNNTVDVLQDAFSNAFGKEFTSSLSNSLNLAVFSSAGVLDTFNEQMIVSSSRVTEFGEIMKDTFGENGAAVGALSSFLGTVMEIGPSLSQQFDEINKAQKGEDGISGMQANALKFAAVADNIGSVVGALSQTISAYAEQKVSLIDQAIAKEKALDGKSEESVNKIKGMEKKKEAIQRKAFETNKKMQIAQALISTASAVAQTFATMPFPLNIAAAAAIGALGLAQVAMIRKTQFSGGSSELPVQNTSLSIGKRGSAVDTAQQTSGGELNYLRGGRTDGTNLGGAGGAMGRKGYANGGEGIIVGERGPEIVSPSAPVDITPNFALGGGETNVNFTINAVDATGVEDLLINQRGNLIRMIREAANENGEEFLPTIDPMAYGSKT